MFAIAVLGLLKEQDMHGYELKKRLSELLGPTAGVSFGSLYPALARLEAVGALGVLASPAARASSRGAGAASARVGHTGRRRKVYSITPAGAALFEQLLSAPQPALDERAFSIRLAFAGHLPPEGRLQMLERRRASLTERLVELASRAKRGGRYVQLLVERERDNITRDVSWLDRVISEERNAGSALPLAPLDDVAEPPRRFDQRPVPLASASQLQRGRVGGRGPTGDQQGLAVTAN